MLTPPQCCCAPLPDVRINSNDTTVNLTYYGTIQQRTGEEWGNTKLVLSTATPSVGGVAPILPTKHVGYYAPQPVYTNAMPATRSHAHRPRMRHARRGGDRSFAMAHNRQAAMFDMESDDDEDEGDEEAGEVAAAVATSKVRGRGGGGLRLLCNCMTLYVLPLPAGQHVWHCCHLYH